MYGIASLDILRHLAKQSPEILASCKLFDKRELKNTLVVIEASDQGLAGAFNAQVAKAVDQFFANDMMKGKTGHSYNIILVGKKLTSYAAKRGLNVIKIFQGYGDYASPDEINPVAEISINGFLDGSWDRVVIVSTHFRTTLRQDTITRELLPVDVNKLRETILEIIPERGRFSELRAQFETDVTNGVEEEYIFEPSPSLVVDRLVSHLVSMQIYQLVLESNASEHSARRVAMKSASDNAIELTQELTLIYNKARQAGITKEMTEISAALATL